MTEKTPLLHYRLATDSNMHKGNHAPNETKTVRKLGTLFGVVVPTLLSMFSVVVFLRIGFVVGQAGLYQSIAMFLVAYFIITMTVLSVCAISTNGALNAGGAYYMISRALGPEFGGSIGIMFFFANVCGSALYILGLVEAILSTFGIPEDGFIDVIRPYQVLPSGYWWSLLYGSALLLLCFIVCLVGAHIYAKTTFIIFIIVISVLASILISFFIVGPQDIALQDRSLNGSGLTIINYTGFHLHTLKDNLMPRYTVDYTTGAMMSFTTVFAVMFNGCTGIMAGSNMSGDLKNPSYSIPRGTLAAVFITFTTYNVLSVLAACCCDRRLLQRDYSFLGDLNIWPPLVKIGVYSAAISAAMSNLIGASRVLFALSKDNLFGGVLALAKKTSRSGNPWASVLTTWFLVQMVLLAGKLNTIAGVVTIFFLLVYAAVNLACLALEWASAPNFRPSFRCFTWHTCSLGILGCLVMMFLINGIYAFSSIAFMLVLFLIIHHFGPISQWGYISQALIFHQVRKYLLKLDVRKDHVKFWRPQILLMVANPDRCVGLITFINDLKKSGLYVLGHVTTVLLDGLPFDHIQSHYDSWLSLVDHLNIKAFVNLTLADSVRHGVQNLLFITGFGGMRPNTLVLGFHGDSTPQEQLHEQEQETVVNEITTEHTPFFPIVHAAQEFNSPNEEEYVSIISDAVKMGKNVALARYFSEFYRDEVLKPSRKIGVRNKMGPFIDVWPLNLLRPDSTGYVDVCSLFLLQLGCVLQETRAWSQARLRLFLCVEAGVCKEKEELKLQAMLKELRIFAKVHMITWDEEVALHWNRHGKTNLGTYCCNGDRQVNEKQEEEAAEKEGIQPQFPSHFKELTDEFICTVNKLIHRHSVPQPAVRFLYLPRPPADSNRYSAYLHQVNLLSRDLGPTLLVHGIMPVVTTDL